MNFINLLKQYQQYKNEIDESIANVLSSSSFIGGEQISKLETTLANYVGVKHCIVCSSGTDALLLSLLALDIKPNDEIITTTFTFIATAEVIAFLGAKPIFVDIDEQTYNIDVSQIESKITDKTKAIIPVSLFGQVSDMDHINTIAKKYSLYVIEDAAQSFGATYKNKKSCSLSDIATTSFFPAKPLGCYGDGGAVFLDDDELANDIRVFLNHGQTEKYIHSKIGINGRLDSIQAAILNVKIQYYDKEIEIRQKIVERYNKNLQNVIIPTILKESKSVWAQYCIRVKHRESFINKLNSQNIPSAIYYPIPMHLQPVFKKLGYKEGDFPVSEKISKDIIALPFSPFLTKEEQDLVIKGVNNE